jgi:alkanesulfonate monooxygenase SsuD/methylene tetrahydromethanopterin reductase-like flavin-dependent oxidoreductase (luciferase family)
MAAPERHSFGIILGDQPVTVDARAHLDMVLSQVEAAQRNGFTYICLGQHFLYDGFRWLQPIPLLARLAAETGAEVRLAPTVIVSPFYHPVVLAEELATLDIISGGRLIVGVGSGYAPAEFEHMQVPYEERFRRMEEGIELMRLAWRPEPFDFDGEFWQLHNATPHVLPVQRPHPPLWLGAMRSIGVRRAARLGDAWMVTPETPFWEARESYALFCAERAKRGLGPVAVPMRREIVIGRDRADALENYAARSRDRYLAYTQRGNDEYQRHGSSLDNFEAWAAERAIFGSAAECVAAIEQLDAGMFSPLIVRAAWPGQTGQQVIDYLDQLGREVISAVTSSGQGDRMDVL